MDYLGMGLIAAVILLAAFLLLRRSGNKPLVEPTYAAQPVNSPRSTAKQQALDLDPQTRFIESPKRRPYRLFNDVEQELYHRLREAMPNMQVFGQVGVAQLALARGRQEAQRLSRMAGRGVDFVICDQDFAIIAAIELAWPTSGSDAAEDEKRSALHSLGVPLIVFRPNKLPDADTISREIADAIVRRNRMEAER